MSVPNPPAAAPAPQLPPPVPPVGGAAAAKKHNVLALIAMIVAIVGFLFACIPGALIVGWILLPIAFALSIVSLFLKGDRKWMGVVGLIVAIVGTIVGFIVFFAVVATAVDDAFGSGETSISQPTDEVPSADAEAASEPADDEPTDTRQELVLVETAFGRTDYDPSTWWYVAIFENPNADYVFQSAAIDAEALDASGVILDSSSDYTAILSGRTAVTGHFMSVGDGQIATINLRGPMATDATRSPGGETGTFAIADVVPTTDRYSTSVHGKVTSSFGEDQELVQVVVVARDASGKIIAADSSYVDRLPTGGTAQFEVRFLDPLPSGTKYEAYANL